MKRANLLLGVALLLPYLWLAVTLDSAKSDSGHDFMGNVWIPGRLLLLGYSPYQPPPGVAAHLMSSYPEVVANYRLAVPGGGIFDGGGDEYLGILYPLWPLLITLPFAAPDFPTGQRLWAVATALLLVSGLALAMMRWRKPTTTPQQFRLAYAGLVGCGVLYLPLLTSQNGGQNEGLLVGLIGLLLYADQQRQAGSAGWGWVAGAALAALTIKPQITGLLLLLYLLVWLRGRRWSLLVSFALTSLVLYLPPLLLRPNDLGDLLNAIAGRQPGQLAMASASWWGVAYAVVGRNGWTLVAMSLVVLSLLLLVVPWRQAMQHDDAASALSVTLIVTTLISSYIFVYHETILLVAVGPLWLVVAQLSGRRRLYWLAALLLWQVVLPLLLLRAGYALGGGYPFIIQPLVLLAIYYFRPVANQQAATPATVLPQGSS